MSSIWRSRAAISGGNGRRRAFMRGLWRRGSSPTGAPTRSDRLVAETVAVGLEGADRLLRFVRERHEPVLLRRAGEQRALDRDRIEGEVVERGDPARIGAPRPHEQVAEEA